MSQPKSIYELVREWREGRTSPKSTIDCVYLAHASELEVLLREWDEHLRAIGDEGLWMGAVQGRKKILGLPGEKP